MDGTKSGLTKARERLEQAVEHYHSEKDALKQLRRDKRETLQAEHPITANAIQEEIDYKRYDIRNARREVIAAKKLMRAERGRGIREALDKLASSLKT